MFSYYNLTWRKKLSSPSNLGTILIPFRGELSERFPTRQTKGTPKPAIISQTFPELAGTPAVPGRDNGSPARHCDPPTGQLTHLFPIQKRRLASWVELTQAPTVNRRQWIRTSHVPQPLPLVFYFATYQNMGRKCPVKFDAAAVKFGVPIM